MKFVLGENILGTDTLGASIPISQDWSVQIIVDAVDITANLTGQITVKAEERLARTAQFSYFPNVNMDGTVVIDPDTWVGKSVSIKYNDSESGLQTIFVGKVNLGQYDPITRIATVDASDLFQELFEQTESVDEILALIPSGYYSEAVFSTRENGWEQAEDIMSTTPYDVHLDRTGILKNVPWAISNIAQEFNANSIIQNSVTFNNIRRRDIINEIRFKYQYRFTRLKERSHRFSFPPMDDFCYYLRYPYGLATKEQVIAAAKGAGWIVDTIRWIPIPEGAWYLCWADGRAFYIGWVLHEEHEALIAWGASWTAYKRWAQVLTEHYNIVVKSTISQSKYGVLVYEDAASETSEFDSSNWVSTESQEIKPFNSSTLFRPNEPEGFEDLVFETDINGDRYADVFETELTANDQTTIIAYCKTRIRDAHRRNYVQWSTPLAPTRDLSDTLRINYETVDATGKLHNFEHKMDLISGSATTTFTIAISRGSGGTDTTITTLPRPDEQLVKTSPSDVTYLNTYVGGHPDSPPYNPEWQGLITNSVSVTETPDGDDPPGDLPPDDSDKIFIDSDNLKWRDPSSVTLNQFAYPPAFRVNTPEVEEDVISDTEPGKESLPIEIEVSIPQDPIVYKA